MLSGKNIMYISFLAIAGLLIYYFFFKKKIDASTLKPQAGIRAGEDVPTIQPNKLPETEEVIVDQTAYIGPQDCSENCDGPYERRVLDCYNKYPKSETCLADAERMKQECVSKCDQTMPSYRSLEQIATPIQEENYINSLDTLFAKGYV